MKAVEIKKGIYWVGAVDWDLRNFHGYLTQRGSSYNAYLIVDEKITLIDTVKAYLVPEMLERIASIVDPSKIDYVISNHVEMDHSGGIPAIAELAPDAVFYASPKGVEGIKAHYGDKYNLQAVKGGESISLGQRSVEFLLTPMIHWPDNMMTYMPEEKILFSNDAFGQHLASSQRFDDEYPLDIVIEEARKYYANIVLPYSAQVKRALVEAAKLEIELIATSHGIMWRSHIPEILQEYTKWSSNETEKKAIICYDTMWGSTKKMAEILEDVMQEKGYATAVHNVSLTHISDIMTELITAEYICVGSPTLNNNMMPSVASFLTYMKGLAPKNRKAVAFGSYGWGGQSIGQVADVLADAGFDVKLSDKIQYIPSEDELAAFRALLNEKID